MDERDGHQFGSHREAQTSMQQAKRVRCSQADSGLLVEEVQRDLDFLAEPEGRRAAFNPTYLITRTHKDPES